MRLISFRAASARSSMYWAKSFRWTPFAHFLAVFDPNEGEWDFSSRYLSDQLGGCEMEEVISANFVDRDYRLSIVPGHQEK
jgi:hypothetical protein